MLALDQSNTAQIAPAQPQKIESEEARYATPEQQFVELRAALFVCADDLAIKDGRCFRHQLCDLLAQLAKARELVTVAETSRACPPSSSRGTKAVMLDLEQPDAGQK